MLEIIQFQDKYTQDVIELVLHFQNDGSRPKMTLEDQPDLLTITKSYIQAGGNFWIAVDDGRLAGSVGIVPCGNDIAAMKKFFVYEKYQGEPFHLGRQLYDKLIDFAKEKGIKQIMLDTPKNTTRAHKFYEKAGFKKIEESELPAQYSHHYKGSDFFLLTL